MSDANYQLAHEIAVALGRAKYAHLERRVCTKDAPMPMEDKDKYRWGHPDATFVQAFFNLHTYQCPHCQLMFNVAPS